MTQGQPAGTRIMLTGASQGIGRSSALLLAAEGGRLALVARSAGRLHNLVAETESGGGQALALPCNVGDRRQVKDTLARPESEVGGIDVLINNAATGRWDAGSVAAIAMQNDCLRLAVVPTIPPNNQVGYHVGRTDKC